MSIRWLSAAGSRRARTEETRGGLGVAFVACLLLASLASVPLSSGATGGGAVRTERRWVLEEPTWPSIGPQSLPPYPPPRWVQEDVEVSNEPAAAPVLPLHTFGIPSRPNTPAVALGWNGVDGTAKDGFFHKPPDTHMAVGAGAGAAGRVVMATNSGIQIWDKAGTSLAGPTALGAFLGIAAGQGFDPKVLYDQLSGRFFIVALEGSTPNPGGTSNLHVAISTTGTPGNLTTNWTKLVGSALTLVGGFNCWFDYPSLGADSGSLFVTGNLFDAPGGGAFRGIKIRVFDKSALLLGLYTFVDIDVNNAVTPGAGSAQPAHVFGSTDSGNFYMVNLYGFTLYRLWEIAGAPAAPTISGNATRSWTAGAAVAGGAPQSGSAITLQTLSPRCMSGIYRTGHVWTALSSDTDADGKSEVFWAKIATNGGLPTAPSLTDSGSINGSDGDEWVFMPAITTNSEGTTVVTYSQSFSDQFPEMRYATRLAKDGAGTFQTSVVAKTSVGFYDAFFADNPDRWGDYSAAAVDPDDDKTFWVANEWVQVSGVNTSIWGTYIAKLDSILVVDLVSFGAAVSGSDVTLSWTTASETNNEGFNVYRSIAETGPWTKLNQALIPGAGTSFVPHDYVYVDTGAPNGVNWYRLEDVDIFGTGRTHPPIQVLVGPRCGAMGTAGASAGLLTVSVLPVFLLRRRGRR